MLLYFIPGPPVFSILAVLLVRRARKPFGEAATARDDCPRLGRTRDLPNLSVGAREGHARCGHGRSVTASCQRLRMQQNLMVDFSRAQL